MKQIKRKKVEETIDKLTKTGVNIDAAIIVYTDKEGDEHAVTIANKLSDILRLIHEAKIAEKLRIIEIDMHANSEIEEYLLLEATRKNKKEESKIMDYTG